MLFQQYLNNLDNAIRAGGNFRSAIFDDVANIVGTPTRDQLLIEFLPKLMIAINLETGRTGGAKDAGQASARGRAIAEIANFLETGGASVFSNIDKNAFAFQLALRVRSPRIINQGQTTLCGPVAMVYDIAKRDPERYVRFAIALLTTGTGQLGVAQITASTTIRNGYQRFLPEADYVVLASIRDSDAVILSLEPLRNVLTLTKPGALCEFMRQAGFTDVQDHSFLELSTPLRILNAVTKFGLHGSGHNSFDQGANNLQAAQTDLNVRGRFVVMNADAAVAGAFLNGWSDRLGVRPDPLPAAETHWTAVRKLRITGNTVRMKIVTWGGSYEGSIAKDALLSRYAGFISAQP